MRGLLHRALRRPDRPDHGSARGPFRGPAGLPALALVLAVVLPACGADGQEGFRAGDPLETTDNARVFGSFHFAESCSYDPARDLYVTPNVGTRSGPEADDDGYVSLINPDGTVHTPRWIGVTREGLELADPLGSHIVEGVLYIADGNAVRSFDAETGRPLESVVVEEADFFNDIEATPDGTIYATQTSEPERIYRIGPDGEAEIFVDGDPLSGPNGVSFDPDGNVVVVNVATADVLTFSPEGELLRTEESVDPGNDGLVILDDGTKYVSSVRNGTIGVIRPDGSSETVASGIPSAASMCYDPNRHRLVVPMNDWNALAFVDLE